MPASSKQRAFIVMPFGKKKAPDGTEIDFDAVYADLIKPALEAADLIPHRADAERRAGSIHADMFQDLLLSELVVADMTVDNPNVWYELGVRDALRASGAVMIYALRDRLPFDVAGQRMLRYTLVDGKPSEQHLGGERRGLTEMIRATLAAWRERRASPVYAQLPNLKEPDWKSLKVGAVNEFWQGLEDWLSRIKVAARRQCAADILVLADDTPNRVLELEALRAAADALVKLNRPYFALGVLKRAARLDPDDAKCRQLEAMALGRTGRFEDAREKLARLADERGSRTSQDGETLGLLARTWKDEWARSWTNHPQRKSDPLAAARDTAGTLRPVADAYADAFKAAPADHYPGINALTTGRVWEHLTGRKSRHDLDLIAAGVRWAVACSLAREQTYWALITRAELQLLQGEEAALEGYEEAAALAFDQRDRFALDSSRQTLTFLRELGLHPELVAKAEQVIARTERQLDRLADGRPEAPPEPARVVLFSGHMVDDPAVRGEGKEKPARFPGAKTEAAAARIAAALDEIGAGPGDLGICGGACGGDLLFAEACLARSMRLEVRLAQEVNRFVRDSVTFADPDRRWERAFARATAAPTRVLLMPDEIGPAPEGVSIYDRCNRWMMYAALAHGVDKVSFVTLWDGAKGDGPGGAENMVELVRDLTGRRPIVIDPKEL
jgi:tetratricopeptide (TPR) repeat protein